MVRRRVACLGVVGAVAVLTGGCAHERDMPDTMEMPDTMPVVRAMHDDAARDSMLDVMPGGEMARGDSAASMRLLQRKR